MREGQDQSPQWSHTAPSCQGPTAAPCPTWHTRWQSVGERAEKGCRVHLQAVADPPVEDSEVGVQGQQHGREVHLLVDANDRDYLQVEGLQRG